MISGPELVKMAFFLACAEAVRRPEPSASAAVRRS